MGQRTLVLGSQLGAASQKKKFGLPTIFFHFQPILKLHFLAQNTIFRKSGQTRLSIANSMKANLLYINTTQVAAVLHRILKKLTKYLAHCRTSTSVLNLQQNIWLLKLTARPQNTKTRVANRINVKNMKTEQTVTNTTAKSKHTERTNDAWSSRNRYLIPSLETRYPETEVGKRREGSLL